jgi:hypothetical protein
MVAKLSLPPRYRQLSLNNNQLYCAPISAQQWSVGLYYQGPVTCTSIPWTVAFGNCTFSGDYAGAPLVRSGSCPTEVGYGWLDLSSKGITSVQPDAFQDMNIRYVRFSECVSLTENTVVFMLD